MPENYQRELDAALDAARLAGELILSHYQERDAKEDAPADVSTSTDRASQEIILRHLLRSFPHDAMVAEEETPTLNQVPRSGARLWIIDPIDGTRGFVNKSGEFSVMIGFVHEGAVKVGVVLEPAKALITFATRGGDCWFVSGEGKRQRCSVGAAARLEEATLTQSHSQGLPSESWAAKTFGVSEVKETYSAGVKLAMVARAEADFYVNTYRAFRDWDICAGQILVEEAGGIVTGLQGELIQYAEEGFVQPHGLLASNGKIHESALVAMKGIK